MDSAKEKKAIERLKAFEPADGYYLAYSGGKDSDCIKILAQLSGVKFEAVHNLTTVDAPETVRYVQSQPDVKIDKAYDKDGNKIFEGDIVWDSYEEDYGKVEWDNDTAKFIITCSTFTVDFDSVYGEELEIVGNVYDNPELLE